MTRPLFVALATLILGAGPASATLVTYAVNHSFGVDSGGSGDITISGTVTVDDSGGDITQTSELVRISNWSLTFTNPGGAESAIQLTPANSIFQIVGNASIEVTPTELIWNVPTQFQSAKTARVALLDTHGPSDPKQQQILLDSYRQGFSQGGALFETFRIEHDSGDSVVATAHETFVNTFVFGVVASIPEPGLTAVALLGFGCAATIARRK